MEQFRLTGDIVPQSYNLEIVVDIDEPHFCFNGTVSIKVIIMMILFVKQIHVKKCNLKLLGVIG